MAEFTVDLGNRAAKALESRDWSELSRLTPAAKRSKDPAKVAGARKRTPSVTTVPGVPPVQ